MRTLTKILFFLVLILLVGCAENTDEAPATDASISNSTVESKVDVARTEGNTSESTEATETEEAETEDSTVSQEASVDEDSDETSEENNDVNETALSNYSNEQIEYARVWLLLGENQEVDELNVTKIPAGTKVNPNDESSASYPEDVIQLSGSRLVDGSVTYSGNGDGTINVYEVPLRWETNLPEDLDEDYMQELTQSMIDHVETVYVDPGNDEEVIELIEVMNIQG